MNQETVFASGQHFGQNAIVECGEFPFASIKEMGLKHIKLRNEKTDSREFIYQLGVISPAK